MAGWKLRKDKTQGEASEEGSEEGTSEVKALAPKNALSEDAPPAEMQRETPAEEWKLPEEPFLADLPLAGPTLAAAHNGAEEEPEPLPHFDDDVLPEPEAVAAPAVTPPPVKPVARIEPVALAEPAAPPSLIFPASPAAPEVSGATLRMDRSELPPVVSSPSGFSIPPVSPFLVALPKEEVIEVPHTLQVRIGRLSATFEMTKEVTVIGRPDSELHFYPDIEIDLDDAVSRRHAEILRHEKDYYLVDAGSTNGTLLNGEMLKPHEEKLLAHGDRIRVGERTEIIFE